MDVFTVSLWSVTLVSLAISLKKDKNRTLGAMKMGKGMMKNMLSSIVAILFLLGLMLSFVPPETIQSYLGGSNVYSSTIISAFVGSITLIPAFVAFPLVGSLVDAGASIVPAVAFLTTLTMVGFVTFPLEKAEFGSKFAVSRNVISFIFAVIIALLMGIVI